MISLMRVDDRLVHGQVAIGWTSSINANVILVVNDEAKNDQVRAMALNMAKPQNVKLYIRGLSESVEIIEKFSEAQKSKVLVIVKDINDAYYLIKNTENVIKRLNIGGLPYSQDKKKLSDLIYVNDEDIKHIKEIENLGVEVDFRMLPRDKKQTLNNLL